MKQKKIKCDICGKIHPRETTVIECSDCYVRGWKKEWDKSNNAEELNSAPEEKKNNG